MPKKKKSTEVFNCEYCGKEYKTRTGMNRHQKRCPARMDPGDDTPLSIEKDLEMLTAPPTEVEETLVEPDDYELSMMAERTEEDTPPALNEELQRLQEEYKKQKEITDQLEQDRLTLQREREEFEALLKEKRELVSEIDKAEHSYQDMEHEVELAHQAQKEIEEERRKLEQAQHDMEEERHKLEQAQHDLEAEKDSILKSVADSPCPAPEEEGEEPAPTPEHDSVVEEDMGSQQDQSEGGSEEPARVKPPEDISPETPTETEPNHEDPSYNEGPGITDQPTSTVIPEEIERKLNAIERSALENDEILSRLSSDIQDMKYSIENVSTTGVGDKMENLIKKISKIEEDQKKHWDKLTNVILEMGIGEVIDVSKVPPDILENVYEATLNDVVEQMHSHIGSKDMDIVVTQILEDIRKQTSGSELFYYDGRKIRTRKLATYIEKKLISARQVQTTFETFVLRLSEHTHKYTPKNFKAMVSIKSSEYAVNNARLLRNEMTELVKEFDSIKSEIYQLEDRFNSKIEQLESGFQERAEKIDDRLENLDDSKDILIQDVGRLVQDIEGTEGDHSITNLIKSHQEMIEKIKELENTQQINVTRFSAIEKRILGDDLKDKLKLAKDKDDDAAMGSECVGGSSFSSDLKALEDAVEDVSEEETPEEETPEEETPEEETPEEETPEEETPEEELEEETPEEEPEEETPEEEPEEETPEEEPEEETPEEEPEEETPEEEPEEETPEEEPEEETPEEEPEEETPEEEPEEETPELSGEEPKRGFGFGGTLELGGDEDDEDYSYEDDEEASKADGSDEKLAEEEDEGEEGELENMEIDLDEHSIDLSHIILGLINEGFSSRSKITQALKKRDIEHKKPDLEKALDELVAQEMIVAKKKGRYFQYLPADQE